MVSKIPVLIVEDVEEMRLMMEQLINGMKRFKVSGSSGSCVEARLELTRRRPSLVLLDEILPGESSQDLLREIVQDGIPVVLMTGMENPDHGLPAGARSRLIKPGWKSLVEDGVRIEAELLAALGR
jgi:response regulator of citrate/malate metabolism